MTETSTSTLSAAPVGVTAFAAPAPAAVPAPQGLLVLLFLSVWLPVLPAALLLALPLLPPVLGRWLPSPTLALAGLGAGLLASLALLARVAQAMPSQRSIDAGVAPGTRAAEPAAVAAPAMPAVEPDAATPVPHERPATTPTEAASVAVVQARHPDAGAAPADARVALQLQQQHIGAAIGEAARRTIALCGMLDSDMRDAECAQADVEAIQDEERNALQLMAALRARLLALVQHCQALAEAARSTAAPRDAIDALAAAAAAELTQCHQLSERIGGAERMNERRIDSMRRSTERLLVRAERGMHEAQQLMVLTRQVQAAQAASLQRLEQIAALEP